MPERTIAGRYRLVRPLGRGGMGTVWLGADTLAGRQVAVKELRAPDGVTDAEREVFRKRALQEARSAARLAHPNAVTLYDIIPASADDDAVYLIMEYVDGATLADVIRREGPLDPLRVTRVARPLLSILEAAHTLGIVHRDIKPANIMIGADGQVKLADFGIAHLEGGTRLTGSGVIGTPAYLAPEQLHGLPVTPAVDLWALGVTLQSAVAGRNPFDRETTAATFQAILMAELPAPACGPPLATVIGGLLVRDPAQRMTTAQARALLADESGGGQAAGPAGPGATLSAVPGAGPPPSGRQPTFPGLQGRRTGPTGPANVAYPLAPGPPENVLARRRLPVRSWSALVTLVVAAVAVVISVLLVTSMNRDDGNSADGSNGSPAGTARASPAATASESAAEPAAGTLPERYVGHWHGTLSDNTGLEGPQAADLTLAAGKASAVVGTVSYPTVGCDYDLRLVSSTTQRVELYEEIKSGLCESEYVVLAPAGDGITESVYSAPPSGGQPDFTGLLAKS